MKITHVNHASVLIEKGAHFLLTDPWYVSPAFGGWVQNPSPFTEMIRRLLSLRSEALHVVISHGHDDHADDFFISRHLKRAKFYVPQFKTNGLSRRIESLSGVYPVELTETPVEAGGFSLSSFINEDYTLYDAIIVIEGPGCCLIHANDNWHAYPASLTQKLRSIVSKYAPQEVFFMTQFGIADCFPMSYTGYSQEEFRDIIERRFESYASATVANLCGIGAEHGFYYANQATFAYPSQYAGRSTYDLAEEYVAQRKLPFRQLNPGTGINFDAAGADGDRLFDTCLQCLEAFVQKRLGGDKNVRFGLLGVEHPDSVTYQADKTVWQRIFIGELTLEAITIGGMGMVSKPKEMNIASIHHTISKLAYLIQANIRKDGMRFLLGEP